MDTTAPNHRRRQQGGKGRFVRSADTAARDAEACRLRTTGMEYHEIAEQLGFSDKSAARKAVERALRDTAQEPAAHLRTIEVARLDLLLREAWTVMKARHVAVNNGRVIMDPDDPSKPLTDHGPVLAAIDRVLKIAERRAKLLGLDAPTKVTVITVDEIENEIARLADELSLNDPDRTPL